MAQITNLYDRYDVRGDREALTDILERIDPEETPVYQAIGRVKATGTFPEWQTDSLRAANKDNAAVEGDQASAAALTPTNRLANQTQIFQETVALSGTALELDYAGRKDELKMQIAKSMAQIKRDMEASITQNNAAVAGNSTTARKSAGLETMIITNISSGVGGSTAAWSTGAATTAPTDGTQRAFTETLLKTVLATGVQNGMRTRLLSLGALQKQVFSSFPGIAQTRFDVAGVKQSAVIGAADVYVSDFGKLTVVIDLFQRNRTALLLDPEYAAWATFRPMKKSELPADGDFVKYQMLTEGCLVVKNEKAHAKVADLS